MPTFIRVLNILLAIAFVVLLYYVVISVPDQILKVVFVIIGLIAAINALSGRMDHMFLNDRTP